MRSAGRPQLYLIFYLRIGTFLRIWNTDSGPIHTQIIILNDRNLKFLAGTETFSSGLKLKIWQFLAIFHIISKMKWTLKKGKILNFYSFKFLSIRCPSQSTKNVLRTRTILLNLSWFYVSTLLLHYKFGIEFRFDIGEIPFRSFPKFKLQLTLEL